MTVTDALGAFALAMGMGVVLSITPGPAGLVILAHALEGASGRAWRALGALMLAELLAVAVTWCLLPRLSSEHTLHWLNLGAGAFMIGFGAFAWRKVGRGRITTASNGTVFRITLLNPAVWLWVSTMLTLAATYVGSR